MCIAVLLYRPGDDWPLLLAANRDERLDRPFLAPARHWPDRPAILAGKDLLAGGTWLGCHDSGLIVAMLNRRGSLGPQADKRSRGHLALDLLACGTMPKVLDAISAIDTDLYRPFNALLADEREAYWVRHDGSGLTMHPLMPGLSMLGAEELNDSSSLCQRHYSPLFQEADIPDPEKEDWHAWQELLFSTDTADGGSPRDAMYILPDQGYGTSSSSLIALSSSADRRWLFSTKRSPWHQIS